MNMLDGEARSGWVLDACHDQVRVGDIIIADYRGTPLQRFEVLEDTGTGLFKVRRPDGEVSMMRPSTILAVAKRIERLVLVARRRSEGIRVMTDQVRIGDDGQLEIERTWDGEPLWSVETQQDGLFAGDAFKQMPGQLPIEDRYTDPQHIIDEYEPGIEDGAF